MVQKLAAALASERTPVTVQPTAAVMLARRAEWLEREMLELAVVEALVTRAAEARAAHARAAEARVQAVE